VSSLPLTVDHGSPSRRPAIGTVRETNPRWSGVSRQVQYGFGSPCSSCTRCTRPLAAGPSGSMMQFVTEGTLDRFIILLGSRFHPVMRQTRISFSRLCRDPQSFAKMRGAISRGIWVPAEIRSPWPTVDSAAVDESHRRL